MKQLIGFAAMVLFPLAMVGQFFKFTQDGAFANVSGSSGPNSSFTLQVASGASSSAGSSSSLQYFAFTETPTTISFDNVFGPIPSGAFSGQNVQDLVLSVDISTLDPTLFFAESCSLDLTTFSFSCGAFAPGSTVIQLEFKANGAQRTRVLALEQEMVNGPVTTRSHQRSDNSTANAQGSLFGMQLNNASATVGVNHMSTIEITHQ